jgi:peptidoglycan/xylan/chitin deacetylase (PgdA/CDA1 family)
MFVTAQTFEGHAQFLKAHFHVIPFNDLLSLWEERRWDATQRYCVVTFDDGWLDNYIHAFPILQRYALPATIFLPTGFIGTTRWFWPDQLAWVFRNFSARGEDERLRCLGKLRTRQADMDGLTRALLRGDLDGLIEYCKPFPQDRIDSLLSGLMESLQVTLPSDRQVINWDEARAMSAAGVSFGSHSVNHRILTGLNLSQVAHEVEHSGETLRHERVNYVPVFCYPNGDWSADIGCVVERAGYKAATTTEFGYETANPASRFALKRVNVHDYVTSNNSLFAFHLTGHNSFSWW